MIDGHNDLVLKLWEGGQPEHVRLEDAAATGFAGGFFALYVPSPHPEGAEHDLWAQPFADPIPFADAEPVADELYEVLCSLPVRRATAASDFEDGAVTAVVHLEGAEAVAPDLSNLEAWYGRGLRSIGVVWSRPNAFGEGVPFRFPASPDTGPGLTEAGRALVAECNRLGILVDLSHLNEAGFWDVAAISEAPLVATHSNAHALCPASRNLTDRQLLAVRDSGGVVGVNFAVTFLREDGRFLPEETTVGEIVRHVDYLVELMGVDHVALGSDFDGAGLPSEVDGLQGLPRIVDALRSRYDDEAVAKVTHENWLRVFDATWR